MDGRDGGEVIPSRNINIFNFADQSGFRTSKSIKGGSHGPTPESILASMKYKGIKSENQLPLLDTLDEALDSLTGQ